MAEGLQIDLTQRIINVHWGGGFAIVGTARDITKEGPIGVFYGDGRKWNPVRLDPDTPAPPPPVHEPSPKPRETGIWENNLQAMVGGQVGTGDESKRVIVAGGIRSEMFQADVPNPADPSFHSYRYQYTALLFYSENAGQAWHEITCPVTALPGTTDVSENVIVNNLAFDPVTQTFYGDVQKTMSHVIGGVSHLIIERHLISSTNGKTWKIDKTESRDISTGADDWTAPFITKVMAIRNNGLTEIGYTDAEDPNHKVMLTYTTVDVVQDQFGGNIKLAPPWQIDGTNVTGIPYGSRLASGFGLAGIAYANGMFLIAGSLMRNDDDEHWQVIAYLSNDNGVTWEKTLDDSTTFVTNDPYAIGGIGPAGSSGCGA